MTTRKKQPAKGLTKKSPSEKKKAPAEKKPTPKISKKQPTNKSIAQFPIVGIGSSAGGLEAFEDFFKAMPKNSGMAFVLIAHLDPSHSSILPELIQKKTKMKVTQATDNLKIQPNQVYTIAPNKEMAILNGADPIIIEDLDGRIMEANDEAVGSYGWLREELVGKAVNMLTPPERHAQTAELLKICKKNRDPARNIEGLRLYKSDKIIPVLLTYALLADSKDKFCAIATIAKNYPPSLTQ